MKYYIDFDNTMFDTNRFVKDINDILRKYLISEKIINKINNFEENKNFYHNINKDIDNLQIIKDIDNVFKNTYKYLYDDTIFFLEYCFKQKIDLNLLTKGDKEYQQLKLEHTNISKYFKDIIITEKHKDELDIDYRHSFFIDDDVAEIMRLLKKTENVIRIKRNSNKHSLISLDNITEYNDLASLINKI